MGTATELERLVVRLAGDGSDYDRMISKATADINHAANTINSHAKKIQAAGESIRNTGLKMTAAITLPVAGMVKSFASFDDKMTQSVAIMGDVSAEMRREMENTARTLSLSTKTSATDLAESYFFLASAGMNVVQSMAALPVVEKFATAGAFDMAKATDLLTDAQSALGLSSKDAEKNMQGLLRVSDILVRANTLANASVEQFSESLTNEAGAAIKQFNMDLEEGVAILATYADQGLKGNAAGSMLARMTRLLIKAVNDNKGAFERLNIPIEEFAKTGKNVTGVIEGITKATEGLGPAEKAATLEALGFQARIQQAILPLLGATDKIKGYEKALKEAGGTTKDIADRQLKSFSSQIKIVWNNILDFANDIGRILAPYIKKFGDFIKNLSDEWRGLGDETKKTIGIIIGITAALGPVLTIIGSIVAAAGGLVVVMSAAFAPAAIAAFAAALPGILAATLSIAAAVAAIGAGVKYVIDLGKIKENEGKQKELVAINEEMRKLISLQKEQESIIVRQTMLKNKGNPAFDPNELERAKNNIQAIKNSIKELNEESQNIVKSGADPIRDMTAASQELLDSITKQTNAGYVNLDQMAKEETEREKLQKQIDKQIAALKSEHDTFGMTSGQIALYNLKLQGATEAEIKSAESIVKKIEALKKEKEARDKILDKQKKNEAVYRRLVDQATIAEINNTYKGIEKELKLHEYKFTRLKELYTEGSKELTEIERLETAERMAILKEMDETYWTEYIARYEKHQKDMGDIEAQVISNMLSQFSNFFSAVVEGTGTIEDAFKNLGKGLLNTIVNVIGQLIEEWILYKIAKIAINKATHAAAIPEMIAAAEAGSLLAGINAYASAAAIPYAGWIMAPGAMATALAVTEPMVAGVSAAMVSGLAHSGIDSIPETGTWLLEKGERVVTQGTSVKLDRTLDNIRDSMKYPGYSNSDINNQKRSRGDIIVHNHYDGPVFLDKSQMRDASKAMDMALRRERERLGATA